MGQRITVSAAVRFRPTPPAFKLIRKILVSPFWNAWISRSILGGAGQERIADFPGVEARPDQVEQGGELREDQNPSIFLHEFA
jgi:hypothetical protein